MNRFRTKRSRIFLGIASVFLLLFIASSWGCSTNTEQLAELEGRVYDQATAIATLSTATATATPLPSATPQPTATPDPRIAELQSDLANSDVRQRQALIDLSRDLTEDIDEIKGRQGESVASQDLRSEVQELVDEICLLRYALFRTLGGARWNIDGNARNAEVWLYQTMTLNGQLDSSFHDSGERLDIDLCSYDREWHLP